MSSDVSPPPEPERLLELLEPLIAADTIEALLDHARRLLDAPGESFATAIFVTDGASVVHEAWQPEDEARRARLRPHFLALTYQSVKSGTPTTLPFASGAAVGLTPHLYLMRARGRVLGAVCCACTSEATRDGKRHALMEALARVLAERVAALLELSSWRVTRAQNERWFSQLDEHIRTLDRERQKFAAVVNQNDVFVFVADAGRAVRWVNRALAARYPVEAPGASWVGRTCHDLCSRLGEGACNGTCPVDRALADNRPAHGEYRQRGPDGDRVLYATGLPIKGPEGRPHEVLVMLQDLTEVETVRRLETRLHAVVASLPIVLFSTDRDGSFTLSEGRGLAALGLRPGQVVGQSAFEFYRGYPDIVENLRRALRGEEFTALVELGELRYETHYAPLRDPGGAITGMIGVATDLTSASRARRAA
jgi:PAS domain-containing protein